MQTAGPKDFDIDRIKSAQTEVQPRIVAGIKARLAKHRLRLNLAAIADQNTSTDGAAVRLDSLQLDFDPILLRL